MPELTLQPLTTEGFASFGDALMMADHQPQRMINNGSSIRFDQLTTLDLLKEGGEPCFCLFRSLGTDITKPLSLLERHQLGSQTFLPLLDVRMLVVVAQSNQSGDAPDEHTMRAFITQPGHGVTIKAGIWHHPLITLGAGDVMVLERKGARGDCEIAILQQQWHIDIEQLLQHI